MKSHGNGQFSRDQFARIGENIIIENGVLIFHPENIEIGDDVYIGHNAILKAYYKNKMIINSGTWIGQQCFFHSAGGITIGKNVGIGPSVKIITSFHGEEGLEKAIMHSKLEFAPVWIDDNSDIGVGSIILPGIRIGFGCQVGAGSVVTKDIESYAVVAGVPARVLRMRSRT